MFFVYNAHRGIPAGRAGFCPRRGTGPTLGPRDRGFVGPSNPRRVRGWVDEGVGGDQMGFSNIITTLFFAIPMPISKKIVGHPECNVIRFLQFRGERFYCTSLCHSIRRIQ